MTTTGIPYAFLEFFSLTFEHMPPANGELCCYGVQHTMKMTDLTPAVLAKLQTIQCSQLEPQSLRALDRKDESTGSVIEDICRLP
ncbi:hypothetical protein T265_09650 [Opisthorchis viverrini]|uniref:Uncharacterized protein n=1 Tax=Opisthorchis viverrini TaxID=6198 RepID=A0A074Z9G7_OPIVI|nr:hypothetical protein T265_09650 [Opisthorchis viverrini]KER22197.1 hypothetical protein T265_09650 [Opisthorchis viverrini]